jgi:hypothetical protein
MPSADDTVPSSGLRSDALTEFLRRLFPKEMDTIVVKVTDPSNCNEQLDSNNRGLLEKRSDGNVRS